MNRVVGLDLSLTSTGMSDGTTHHVFGTRPTDGSVESRLAAVVDSVYRFTRLDGGDPCLVVIEDEAWSRSSQPGHAELSALRLMVRVELWRRGVPFALVAPSTLKKYTSGNGRASKPEMVAAVAERYGVDFGQIKVSHGRYDLADACALAAMGQARMGADVPAAFPASLDAVQWPSLLSDDV